MDGERGAATKKVLGDKALSDSFYLFRMGDNYLFTILPPWFRSILFFNRREASHAGEFFTDYSQSAIGVIGSLFTSRQ
jgi:hypothetical protein